MPKVPLRVHWTRFESPHGRLLVAATDRGVCRIELPAKPDEAFFAWLRRHFRVDDIREDPLGTVTGPVLEQLTAYFAGTRTDFDLPVHFVGSEFQQGVWRALRRIPAGETRSYGEVARLAGRPGAFQATGGAVGGNPVPIVVPCHRVVGADGSLTGYGGGMPLKEALLTLEGATFRPERPRARDRAPVLGPAKFQVRRPDLPERSGLLGKLRELFA